MIFRDDDISHLTKLEEFSAVHDLFIKYKVKHTIALICEGIEKNPALIEYIKANDIEVQIHCWRHISFVDYPKQLLTHFPLCKSAIENNFGIIPTVVYPPWNKSDLHVAEIAKIFGLTISNKKISLSQYVRAGGDVSEKVINFHYWAHEDIMFLEAALNIYSRKII